MKLFWKISLVVSLLALFLGVVSAQDETVSTGVIQEVLSVVAEETGLEIRQILMQLAPAGATLADVIVANGGDVDTVAQTVVASISRRVNNAVENGTIPQERADQLLTNLTQIVTDGLNGELPFTSSDAPRRDLERALLLAIKETTELEPLGVIVLMSDGKTLNQIITENGSTVEATVASAMSIATERVNDWVSNNRLSQAQVDPSLETAFTDILNGEFDGIIGNNEWRNRNSSRRIGVVRNLLDMTEMRPRDLLGQLRDGVTPAQILSDNGISLDTFINDTLARTETRLLSAVMGGRLTREQVDERLSTIRTTLTERLNQPVDIPEWQGGNNSGG